MFAEEQLIGFLHTLGLHRQRMSGRHARVESHEHDHAHQLYQVSTLNAIMEGAYDGALTIGQLREHGDFGLGAFNGLDGEMIVLDGVVYQALVDGTVRQAAADDLTPFAVVQFFEPEWICQVEDSLAFDGLSETLSGHIHSDNYFYSLRIDGVFESLRMRSVARQKKPYPPLTEVVKHQHVFELDDVSGSIVGFRFPSYAQGVNLPGWHLHFISDDRACGGHVLDFSLTQGTISTEHSSEFYMELPENQEFAESDLGKDQTEAIEQAER